MTREYLHNPAALYRCFDYEGVLLYIGVTQQAVSRQFAHKAKSEWAHLVHETKYEIFTTYLEALEAEKAAIRKEKPIYNKIFNQRPKTKKPKPDPHKGWWKPITWDWS